jgi:hypothetical protein
LRCNAGDVFNPPSTKLADSTLHPVTGVIGVLSDASHLPVVFDMQHNALWECGLEVSIVPARCGQSHDQGWARKIAAGIAKLPELLRRL